MGRPCGSASVRKRWGSGRSGLNRPDDNSVTFGREENGAPPRDVENEMDSYLDDIRLNDRALAPDEVQALAQIASA